MLKRRIATARLLGLTLLALSGPTLAAEVEFHDDGPFAGQGYPFSESVRAGDLLFLAGQVGEDDSGRLAEGGIEG